MTATLPFDHPQRIADRKASNRAARSRAYATLQPGDIIYVGDHLHGPNTNAYTPAHYAQVVARLPLSEDDMGVRGLLGGGCASGPLPTDNLDWWLVGHAYQGVRYHHPGFTDPAGEVARRLQQQLRAGQAHYGAAN